GAGLVVDAGKDCSAVASGDPAVLGAVPVLADPVDRGAERALARFGLIAGTARGTAAGAARAGGDRADRGCARHLRRVAERVLFAGYDVVRERVPRPAGPGPRGGRGADRPARAGAGAGFGPGAGGQDDPPQDPAARRGRPG